ncbi:peptide chain release factor N(5)-glutamine methyltransferase [Kiritimatiellaeota bacterium B1221]|nr:peptide chain release factor N(5)-glutamine methyltransferase [Kiritimatiellaeota bacterium B1221]
MKTWAQLFSDHPEVPPDLFHWWLSDFLDHSLIHLPLQDVPDQQAQQAFQRAAKRLTQGEPVQYVCGRAPFRDLDLKVDNRVLIPRPETEQLVQIALDRYIQPGDRVLDVGTGSGCIALSIKKARPDCQVEGRDISEDALTLARENAALLNLDVPFKQAHLLTGEPFRSSEIILANLPYIGEREKPELPDNVIHFEPHLALFSGPDGSDLILQLLVQARKVLTPEGTLLLETGERQGDIWKQAAQDLGWKVEGRCDLAGRERFWIFHLA